MKIITGMHRSGTSLVARLFYEAGADMGNPDTFYRPDEWNPDGYYEQPDIHSVNMPLINGNLWKFAYFWLPSTKTVMKRSVKFKDEIQTYDQKYEKAIIKETRFCLTLPAWLAYGATVDKILVCLREPIQVAKSIQKRNHTLIRHGLWLWQVHNQRLLENVTPDIPVWYLNYHNLLNPDTYVMELTQAFKFMEVNISEGQIIDLLQTCVKPSMNHHADSTPNYPRHIETLWTQLKEKYQIQMSSIVGD